MKPEWAEADIVMVSALQHYVYCPRQFALIHVEQVFDENIYTLKGRQLHERADQPESETVGDIRIERAMPIWSDRLGVTGKADIVEFHPGGLPYPVEYKRGKSRGRAKHADAVQLCAQALCLEEMLNVSVPAGAIFYHSSRKRDEVEFTSRLRSMTEQIIKKTRAIITSGSTPLPVNDKRCKDCSLKAACLPEILVERTINIFVPVELKGD